MQAIRIGVTQRVTVVPSHGERRDALDQEWSRLLWRGGFVPVPLPNQPATAARVLEHLALDGVVLSGGNDLSHLEGAEHTAPERDAFEHDLLTECGARGIPVVGVCRGMQMLVSFHGGRVQQIDGHVARRHALTLATDVPPFPLTDRDAVNSFHGFGVRVGDLGPALVPVAFAPDRTIEAVAHVELPQWGIMWHPERDPHDERDLDILRAAFERAGGAA